MRCPQSDDRLHKNTSSVVPCRRCGLALGRRLGAAAVSHVTRRRSPPLPAISCGESVEVRRGAATGPGLDSAVSPPHPRLRAALCGILRLSVKSITRHAGPDSRCAAGLTTLLRGECSALKSDPELGPSLPLSQRQSS